MKKMSEVFNINILDSLPTVILLEIFTRLPIHDVARCKVVCKSWLKLISQPNFMNNYARYSPYTSLLLVEPCWREKEIFNLSLHQFSENRHYIRTRLETSPKLDIKRPRGFISNIYVSVSNGLLCLFQKNYNYFDDPHGLSKVERVFISNPMTRECVALPLPIPNWYNTIREFAFCPSTNQFKVVRIVFKVLMHRCKGPMVMQPPKRPIRNDNKTKLEIDIFTVGVDEKWRSMEITDPISVPLLSRYSCSSEGITYNGAFHWILADKIHTLDLGREKDGPIIHLPRGVGNFTSKMSLRVLSDNLCLVDRSDSSQITIWMMNKYGVAAESWTKRVILQCCLAHTSIFDTLFPAALMRNEGALLFSVAYGKRWAVFHNPMEGKECCQFRISDAEKGSLSCHDFFTYAPSFRTLEEITALKGERRLVSDALRN